VIRRMYQYKESEPASEKPGVVLSPRDRKDAARLLGMLVGEGNADSQRPFLDPIRLAEAILEDRRRRAELFNPAMFGEPAWELLLTLFVMDRDGPRLTIGRLAQAAGAKLTTALRWLDYLEDQKLIRREEHPGDARTSFVQLTDKARQALRLYLSGTLTSNL
jgi:DNA-binding MarR family transcriptional regulator